MISRRKSLLGRWAERACQGTRSQSTRRRKQSRMQAGKTEMLETRVLLSGTNPDPGTGQIVNVRLENFDVEGAPEAEPAAAATEDGDKSAELEDEVVDHPARVKRRPLHEPTHEVRRAHEAMGHAQYRPWCRHCVRARKRNKKHSRGRSRRGRRQRYQTCMLTSASSGKGLALNRSRRP